MSHPVALSRRRFMSGSLLAAAGGLLLARTRSASAADLPHLVETDPTAAALGYREDAQKVDAAKFPQHKAGQACANCQFYQGAAAFGGCTLFPGKAVASTGWCSAFNAKP